MNPRWVLKLNSLNLVEYCCRNSDRESEAMDCNDNVQDGRERGAVCEASMMG